jgi:hypothetical protein
MCCLSYHMAPFGLPMRWGQAPFPAWLGDVARVRRLHAVEDGTPDLGYRHIYIYIYIYNMYTIKLFYVIYFSITHSKLLGFIW